MFAQRTEDEQMREILQPMHLPGFDCAPYCSSELYGTAPDSYGFSKTHSSDEMRPACRLNIGGSMPY
jgi:hypothetical protein